MSIIEREYEQTTLPDFETWPTVKPKITKLPEPTIAQEAARLDRLFPGWADRIDIARLDLSCPINCILGQGAYVTRKRFFGLRETPEYLGWSRAYKLVCDDANDRHETIRRDAYWAKTLRHEWIPEIIKRRTR